MSFFTALQSFKVWFYTARLPYGTISSGVRKRFFFQGRFNLTVLASGRQVDGISSINSRVQLGLRGLRISGTRIQGLGFRGLGSRTDIQTKNVKFQKPENLKARKLGPNREVNDRSTRPNTDPRLLGFWSFEFGGFRVQGYFQVGGKSKRALCLRTAGVLVHGWDRIKNVHFYSLLRLSTHTNVKCYLTMTKCRVGQKAQIQGLGFGLRAWGRGLWNRAFSASRPHNFKRSKGFRDHMAFRKPCRIE